MNCIHQSLFFPIILASLLMVIWLSSPNADACMPKNPKIGVYQSVEFNSSYPSNGRNYSVIIGTSAFDLLGKRFYVDASLRNGGFAVNGINNVYPRANQTWQFSVNSVKSNVSATSYLLQANDTILWFMA